MNIGACSRGFGTVVGDCPQNAEASWLRRPFDGNHQTGSHPLPPIPRIRTLFSCVVRTAPRGQVAIPAPREVFFPSGRILTHIVKNHLSRKIAVSLAERGLESLTSSMPPRPSCCWGTWLYFEKLPERQVSGSQPVATVPRSWFSGLAAGRPGTTSAPSFSTETSDSLTRG